MNLQDIINEADLMVPNGFSSANKVSWLNDINQDFFNVVKIPKIAQFATEKNKHEYTLPNDVRAKNIDLVHVGITPYRSLMEGEPRTLDNVWVFDDQTFKLTLVPVPYEDGFGIVRYHRIATTTFTSSNLNQTPDAPMEYHYLYVPALCAYIAKAQDDSEKAQMYENDYRTGLNSAALNYQGGSQ